MYICWLFIFITKILTVGNFSLRFQIHVIWSFSFYEMTVQMDFYILKSYSALRNSQNLGLYPEEILNCLFQKYSFKVLLRNITSKVKVKVPQVCLTLCHPMDCSPWNSPGQTSGVGSLSLLQGIFPTQLTVKF